MVKKILLITAITCTFVFGGFAQTTDEVLIERQKELVTDNPHGFLKDWAIGVEAGTSGYGVTVATSLSPNFKLKAGFDYFNYTYKADFDIDPDGFLESAPDKEIPLLGVLSDPQLKYANVKAIVDYYPRQNGIFSISAGVYFGSSAVALSGKITDYQQIVADKGGPVVFDYVGAIIKPNTNGSFDGEMKFANFIKPYFGFGLGRTIANSRLGFKFDLGVIYQGDFEFKSDNVSHGSNISSEANSFMDDANIPSFVQHLWPVLNFSLSYRIF
jgi:hypothetical protein